MCDSGTEQSIWKSQFSGGFELPELAVTAQPETLKSLKYRGRTRIRRAAKGTGEFETDYFFLGMKNKVSENLKHSVWAELRSRRSLRGFMGDLFQVRSSERDQG